MKTKTFTLQCSVEHANLLSEAITTYAHAAYPPGGSECAQVSREALLESANNIRQYAASEQGADLRKRQRAMLKSAIAWYFGAEGKGNQTQKQQMLDLFER